LFVSDDEYHTQEYDEGFFAMHGDARGLRAFGDTLNGMITNGKANPDSDTAHWNNRRLEDQEVTKRELIRKSSGPAPKGLWQKLFGSPANQAPTEEAPK